MFGSKMSGKKMLGKYGAAPVKKTMKKQKPSSGNPVDPMQDAMDRGVQRGMKNFRIR